MPDSDLSELARRLDAAALDTPVARLTTLAELKTLAAAYVASLAEVGRLTQERDDALAQEAFASAGESEAWAQVTKARNDRWAAERQRDQLRDALQMLRDAWNEHFKTCPTAMPEIPMPTWEQLQEWANAPSDTASAALRAAAVNEEDA